DKQGKFIKRINLLPFHSVGKKVKNYKKAAPMRKVLENFGLLKHATVMPFYVRGLDVVGDLLFVGMSPAAILCINWQSEELIDTFDYSSDSRIAIHGLKVFN
ncbi:MAG: TIGR03032 family protein, partial [Anaerolineaceae bacterium]|nr:TIGR03032 family protein [Anaerolineaceae bacterium]